MKNGSPMNTTGSLSPSNTLPVDDEMIDNAMLQIDGVLRETDAMVDGRDWSEDVFVEVEELSSVADDQEEVNQPPLLNHVKPLERNSAKELLSSLDHIANVKPSAMQERSVTKKPSVLNTVFTTPEVVPPPIKATPPPPPLKPVKMEPTVKVSAPKKVGATKVAVTPIKTGTVAPIKTGTTATQSKAEDTTDEDPRVTILKQLLSRGIISQEEYNVRLIMLGFATAKGNARGAQTVVVTKKSQTPSSAPPPIPTFPGIDNFNMDIGDLDSSFGSSSSAGRAPVTVPKQPTKAAGPIPLIVKKVPATSSVAQPVVQSFCHACGTKVPNSDVKAKFCLACGVKLL
jgi:hypothetical protein